MKTTTKKILLTAMIILLGCSLAGCKDQPFEAPPSGPVPVTVQQIETCEISLSSELPGRITAFRTAEIRPQVSGLILKRLFEEGADVQAGQMLYQIDPAFFQAELDNAKAALARAEANLPAARFRAERFTKLLPLKAVSQQDCDDAVAASKQAEAEVESLKAQVKSALINLKYTKIVAPISGRIGRSNVTEGAIVTGYQAMPLATIQPLDPIYVDVPQSTTELLSLRQRLEQGQLDQHGEGQRKVQLLLEDDSIYTQEGSLQFRDISVDPTTGSVILRAVFPNPQAELLPGMFVRAVIREGVNPQAILIPQQAVSRDRKGNPSVLVVDEQNRVKQRMLTLDRAIDKCWLVSAGLAVGDRIIVEGLQKVRPGVEVRAVIQKNNAQVDVKPGNQASSVIN